MTTYERTLNAILDEVFAAYGNMTLQQVATKARLAVSTVWKIEQRVTKLPRFKTVYSLAKAAGMELNLEVTKTKLKLKRA